MKKNNNIKSEAPNENGYEPPEMKRKKLGLFT